MNAKGIYLLLSSKAYTPFPHSPFNLIHYPTVAQSQFHRLTTMLDYM